jgi:SAM-dependent methyltransferase
VLADVPVLVPEPARWCATFFEPALAALAEVGAVTSAGVETLRAFASVAPGVEPARFSDDWTAWEATGRAAPPFAEGPAREVLERLSSLADAAGPGAFVLERVPDGVVLEVGCGVGRLSRRLARPRRRHLVGDLSLRAVLLSARAAAGAVPVVLDAEALPIARGRLDALVAEHVVDLLDDAEAFFAAAARAVAPQGLALVTTPRPALDAPDDDDGRLATLARRAGFAVEARADGLPWLRRNDGRFLEVWLVQALALRRRR